MASVMAAPKRWPTKACKAAHARGEASNDITLTAYLRLCMKIRHRRCPWSVRYILLASNKLEVKSPPGVLGRGEEGVPSVRGLLAKLKSCLQRSLSSSYFLLGGRNTVMMSGSSLPFG